MAGGCPTRCTGPSQRRRGAVLRPWLLAELRPHPCRRQVRAPVRRGHFENPASTSWCASCRVRGRRSRPARSPTSATPCTAPGRFRRRHRPRRRGWSRATTAPPSAAAQSAITYADGATGTALPADPDRRGQPTCCTSTAGVPADLRPVLRRGPVRATGGWARTWRDGACARTPRTAAAGHGPPRWADIAGQGQAADRAAPALGGAVAAARRTLRAPRRRSRDWAAARHAGAGARRAVPSRLDRSGQAPSGRRAAARRMAHPIGPGRLPRLLLLRELIRLMEAVYHDLVLGALGPSDNRGWINAFRHWSWPMFRIAWVVGAPTFGALRVVLPAAPWPAAPTTTARRCCA